MLLDLWFAWVFPEWHLQLGSITTFGCLEEEDTSTDSGLLSSSERAGSCGSISNSSLF